MNKTTTTAGWIARIIVIAAILFVSMFAFDAFEEGTTVLQKLASFGMHMIPSFVLAFILWLAWKNELAGGIIFIVISAGLAPFIYNMNYNRTQSVTVGLEVIAMINLPFIIAGILFVFSYYKLKKRLAV